MAGDRLDSIDPRADGDSASDQALFAALREIVGAAAMVSKLASEPGLRRRAGESTADFKRRKTRAAARASAISTALETGSLPTVTSRAVRNSIEHYDERMDEWFLALDRPTAVTFDGVVLEAFERHGVVGAQHLKSFERATSTFNVAGQTINMGVLREELRAVGQRAEEWHELHP